MALTLICFVVQHSIFDPFVKVAMVMTHELGHTIGMRHDNGSR